MKTGVPRETKPLEGRVALTPKAVRSLTVQGHDVLVETGAGILSGYPDSLYSEAGASIAPDAVSLYANADLIVKVKEPIAPDLEHLEERHLLFCFLHLAAGPELTATLCSRGLTAIGFETVVDDQGRLPLLAPMSSIAGRIAMQTAATLLYQHNGGKGILLGGIPSIDKGRVMIIGAGTAGGNAALLAAELGTDVTVFDIDDARLESLCSRDARISGLHMEETVLARHIEDTDILVGATLQPGRRTPHIVSRKMVASMQAGSVIVDISVDQGGCVETTRPTSYEQPTFIEEGVIHFAVTNMPGAVPRSASQALSSAILPYVSRLLEKDWASDRALAGAVNVASGQVIHPALLE